MTRSAPVESGSVDHFPASRTIGANSPRCDVSMDWMLPLIGIPYLEGGNNLNGFDCFGLTKWILREDLGVILPEKPSRWRHHGIILRSGAEMKEYDILIFSNNPQGLIDHMGVTDGIGNFIHADRLCGQVVRESIYRRENRIKGIGRTYAAMKKNDS